MLKHDAWEFALLKSCAFSDLILVSLLTAVCNASWRPVTGIILQEQNAVWVPEGADACSCQGAGSGFRVCSWFLFQLCSLVALCLFRQGILLRIAFFLFQFFVLLEAVYCYHLGCSIPAVPNLFGTRDRFRGRQFFHQRGVGNDLGSNASDGERLMKLCSLACRSPPAVRPGS